MATRKLTPAQEMANGELKAYWQSDRDLDERSTTLEVLVRYGTDTIYRLGAAPGSMAPKKLTPAQERAKAKLRSYWLSAWDLDENTRTLEVLARYGIAEKKLPGLGSTEILYRRASRP